MCPERECAKKKKFANARKKAGEADAAGIVIVNASVMAAVNLNKSLEPVFVKRSRFFYFTPKTIVRNNLEEYLDADYKLIFSTLLPNFKQSEECYLECLRKRYFRYNHNIINGQVLAITTNGISFHIIMGKINVRPGTKLLYNGDKNEGISCEKEHQYLYFYLSILDRDDGKLIFKNVFPFAGNTNSDFFSKAYYEHFPQPIKSLIISVLPAMKRAEEKRINQEEEEIRRVELEKKMEMEKEAQREKTISEERLQSIKNIENNILRKLESAK